MTTQETNIENTTTENQAPAEMFYGKDFAVLQSKASPVATNVFKETLKQFAHKIATIKSEDSIKIEGSTIEELQAALAKMMMEKPTASMKPEDINLASASMQDLLKHKGDVLGAFLFELLDEVAEQVKSTGGKGKGTRASNPNRKKADLSLYAVQVEGVNDAKPFLVMNSGAFTKEFKALADKIEAAGVAKNYQKEIVSGPKKGEMGWDKAKILADYGTKVELTSAEIHEKYEGKAGNATVAALGDKMPKLTTKKIDGKKK